MGAMVHLIQTFILNFYVSMIYIDNLLCHPDAKGTISVTENDPAATPTTALSVSTEIECAPNPYAILLLGGVVYPLVYEITQCM